MLPLKRVEWTSRVFSEKIEKNDQDRYWCCSRRNRRIFLLSLNRLPHWRLLHNKKSLPIDRLLGFGWRPARQYPLILFYPPLEKGNEGGFDHFLISASLLYPRVSQNPL